MSNSNFALILLALYFLPGIVASARHHHNRTAISVLNLLLGWTMLGWIGAMVWACTFVAPHDRAAGQFATPRAPMPADSFYIGMTIWVVGLLVVGVALILKIKGA